MNQAIFTLLAWEKELDIQHQARKMPKFEPDVILPDVQPAPARKPAVVLTRLFKSHAVPTQPECSCSPLASD